MAINPATQYPGRTSVPDANYPYGGSQNETVPGTSDDGTPGEIARSNDVFGMQQGLLALAGIVPSGNAETAVLSEYIQAMVELAMGRATNYDDTGVADAYVLEAQANQQIPRSLFDGQEFNFYPANDNTGPATIDPVGLGPVTVALPNGSPLLYGGELETTRKANVVYNALTGRFVLALQQNIHRGALAYLTANQSIPTNSSQPINFAANTYNTDDIHDDAVNNSRLVVPDGVSRIKLTGQVLFNASSVGARRIDMPKNGFFANSYFGEPASVDGAASSGQMSMNISSPILQVVGGDYFQLVAFQSSGGALDVVTNASSSSTWFSMEIII